MEYILPAQMAAPKGHYSPGIRHNGVIYVSGQLPVLADGTVPADIARQTELCMENIATILEAGGSGLGQILKLNIFISDIGDWSKVNSIIAMVLGDHKPARIIVPAGPLHYDCRVEIDAVAAVTQPG